MFDVKLSRNIALEDIVGIRSSSMDNDILGQWLKIVPCFVAMKSMAIHRLQLANG